MTPDDLRGVLERLQAELAQAGAVDQPLRERLRDLQHDIRSVLDRGPAAEPRLKKRLENGVSHFEASHPDLARRLAQVIDTLALYGL